MSDWINVEWDTFKVKFLPENIVFVDEKDSEWCFYTFIGPLHIRSKVAKPDTLEDTLFFEQTFFYGRENLVKGYIESEELEDEYPQDEYPQMGDFDE